MSIHFQTAKALRQAAYERMCRTPGTREHAERMARLEARTQQLVREQEAWRRRMRQESAAASMARTRAYLAPLINKV